MTEESNNPPGSSHEAIHVEQHQHQRRVHENSDVEAAFDIQDNYAEEAVSVNQPLGMDKLHQFLISKNQFKMKRR